MLHGGLTLTRESSIAPCSLDIRRAYPHQVGSSTYTSIHLRSNARMCEIYVQTAQDSDLSYLCSRKPKSEDADGLREADLQLQAGLPWVRLQLRLLSIADKGVCKLACLHVRHNLQPSSTPGDQTTGHASRASATQMQQMRGVLEQLVAAGSMGGEGKPGGPAPLKPGASPAMRAFATAMARDALARSQPASPLTQAMSALGSLPPSMWAALQKLNPAISTPMASLPPNMNIPPAVPGAPLPPTSPAPAPTPTASPLLAQEANFGPLATGVPLPVRTNPVTPATSAALSPGPTPSLAGPPIAANPSSPKTSLPVASSGLTAMSVFSTTLAQTPLGTNWSTTLSTLRQLASGAGPITMAGDRPLPTTLEPEMSQDVSTMLMQRTGEHNFPCAWAPGTAMLALRDLPPGVGAMVAQCLLPGPVGTGALGTAPMSPTSPPAPALLTPWGGHGTAPGRPYLSSTVHRPRLATGRSRLSIGRSRLPGSLRVVVARGSARLSRGRTNDASCERGRSRLPAAQPQTEPQEAGTSVPRHNIQAASKLQHGVLEPTAVDVTARDRLRSSSVASVPQAAVTTPRVVVPVLHTEVLPPSLVAPEAPSCKAEEREVGQTSVTDAGSEEDSTLLQLCGTVRALQRRIASVEGKLDLVLELLQARDRPRARPGNSEG